jgi:hypothetical protein
MGRRGLEPPTVVRSIKPPLTPFRNLRRKERRGWMRKKRSQPLLPWAPGSVPEGNDRYMRMVQGEEPIMGQLHRMVPDVPWAALAGQLTNDPLISPSRIFSFYIFFQCFFKNIRSISRLSKIVSKESYRAAIYSGDWRLFLSILRSVKYF